MPKIAVITGAGAGAGRATVEEFASHGYDVALLSRDHDRLERAAADVRRHGVRALPRLTPDRYGRTAGVSTNKPFDRHAT